VLAALALGGTLGSTELLVDLGLSVPRGGSLGALAAAAVLAVVSLRFRLLDERTTSSAAFYALGIGALAVIAYLGVFHLLHGSAAALVLGTVTVTLAVLAASRQLAVAMAARLRRLEHLALLGRFSAQMAHDLKNPLSAMKGAVQFLQEEHARGRAGPELREFVDLLGEQVERVRAVVERYERIGRVEPVLARASVNEIVAGVVEPQRYAAPAGVEVETRLDGDVPSLSVDRDLVAGALENLLRNAFEALPSGGRVVVRTSQRQLEPERPGVAVSVEDSGLGMDPRVAERAFDDFFTTKVQGSGLGLAFVRRVVEAHGGTVVLRSEAGRGTLVEMVLPGGPLAKAG